MTAFDTVLIGAIGGVVCVFIGLIANWDEIIDKTKKWRTALAVGIAFIIAICLLAVGLNWESDILSQIIPCYRTDCTETPETDSSTGETETKAAPTKSVEIGDIITFGAYEQDGNASNRKEPIEWVVLDKADNKVLVLSTKALDCKPYNDRDVGCTWKTCSLREWLNDEFYKTAFPSEDQERIVLTDVAAHENPDFSTNPGMNTDDYIFLLSVDEVNQYLPYDVDRMCSPTEYAKEHGGFEKKSLGTCWWWLRTPGETSSDACSVNSDGTIDTDDGTVNSDKGCVRPAMWVIVE